jgi:hypothetical protein
MADVVSDVPYPDMTLRRSAGMCRHGRTPTPCVPSPSKSGSDTPRWRSSWTALRPFAKNCVLIVEWFLREHEIHPIREPMPVSVGLQVQVAQPHPGGIPGHLDAFCPATW